MSTAVATISCASAPCSAPSSPKHRLKFLCSHGGKILPRSTDGQLKYVGGESRVISVPRDIPFQEVMKRLTYLIDGEMILKYQLISEDLDALVTVKSDEDLVHMFDEIERYESSGSPRMRAFLFSKKIPSLPSSACSSPKSPDSFTEANHTESLHHSNLHKTLSSQQIRSHYGQLHPQYYQNSGRNSPAPERLVSVRSVGRNNALTALPQSCHLSREINRARCMNVDACSHFSDGIMIERQATLP